MDYFLKLIDSQGIWATVTIFLLFYVLRENAKREKKYQDLIEMLSKNIEKLSYNYECLQKGFDDFNCTIRRYIKRYKGGEIN